MDNVIETIVRALNGGPGIEQADRIEGELAIGLEIDGELYFLNVMAVA